MYKLLVYTQPFFGLRLIYSLFVQGSWMRVARVPALIDASWVQNNTNPCKISDIKSLFSKGFLHGKKISLAKLKLC
jgi:hypothetical protein